MKAYVLTAYGGIENFSLQELPDPKAGPGQVRVRVEAIGINPLEYKIRNGWLQQMMPLPFPAILGNEIAGTIDQVGDGVTTWKIGDKVLGFTTGGAYAEYSVTNAETLTLRPSALSLEHAASLPIAGETVQRVLALLSIQRGQTVLVNGAAGAVGSLAVQLLVRLGAKVIGTASPSNHDYLRSLGAIPVTYGPGLSDRLKTLVSEKISAAFDAAGRDFVSQALTLGIEPGRIVTIVDFEAASLGVQVTAADFRAFTAAPIVPVVDWAAKGELITQVAQVFSFDHLPEAQVLSESGHFRGKIVVQGVGQ